MKKRINPLSDTARILRNQRKQKARSASKPFPPAQPVPLFDDKPWIKMSASNTNLLKLLSSPYTAFKIVLVKEPHQFTTIALQPRGANKIASGHSRRNALRNTAHVLNVG